MGTAVIRHMAPSEAAEVATLLLAANEENLAAFPADVAAAYRVELAGVEAGRTGTEVLVADLDGRIDGTVTFLGDAAHDDHPWPPGGSVLRFLAVSPDARRRSLGRLLAEACIDRARRRRSAYLALHTAPVMAAATRLYERLGFRRAPAHDFHPAAHYAGGRPDGPPWGLAYVLDL